MRDAAFGDEIVDAALAVFVARIPVLDGGVFDFGVVVDNDFDDGGVQLVLVAHGCGATLEVTEIGSLVGDEECALELSGVAGVDAEVGAQLHGAAYAARDIDERAVGEDRRVECGVEVVGGRNDGAEVALHEFGVLAYSLGDRAEDDAFFGESVAEGGFDGDGVHDCVHRHVACESCALFEGNAKFVEGLHDLGVDAATVVAVVFARSSVVRDSLEVNGRYAEVRPLRRCHCLPLAESLEAEVEEPLRFLFFGRDEADNLLV